MTCVALSCGVGVTRQYISTLLFFGFLYTTVPESCNTAISSFFDGFSFSVSVLFTIGFGTNGGDVFFNRCVYMQTVITSEVRDAPLVGWMCGVLTLFLYVMTLRSRL